MNKRLSDADKAERLYTLYEQEMFRVCLAILKEPYAAEDAVSESFVKLIRFRDRINEPESDACRRFVIKLTRNTAIDMYRKCAREREYCSGLSVCETNDCITDTAFDTVLSNTERDILEKLSDKYRHVVECICVDGLTIHETAAVLKISEPCVRKRLERARRQLSHLLNVNN